MAHSHCWCLLQLLLLSSSIQALRPSFFIGSSTRHDAATTAQQLHATTATSSSASSYFTASNQKKTVVQTIGEMIGSGSYGTVHLLQLLVNDDDNDDNTWWIGKRAWTEAELQEQQRVGKNNSNDDQVVVNTKKELADKAARCRGYWKTERHCFQQLLQKKKQSSSNNDDNTPLGGLPPFSGTARDEKGREWMVFGAVLQQQAETTTAEKVSKETIAPTLEALLERDRQSSHQQHANNNNNHLHHVAQALGLQFDHDSDNPLAETMDVVISSLLQILERVHAQQIVHRDIKPANLLVTTGNLVLIDFGSAADLSSVWSPKVGFQDDIVAISPIYAAPEVFVDANDWRSAVKFDNFSAALLLCQLLFGYLDERTESGFHQQLEAAQWNLDAWLQTTLQAKVRPAGLDQALAVLSDRPGLWRLLQNLLRPKPADRLSSAAALADWRHILERAVAVDQDGAVLLSQQYDRSITDDGPYLREVLEVTELCFIAPPIWPLHFVATFARNRPLGLVLAEPDSEMTTTTTPNEKWIRATEEAAPGEVFVQDIIEGGQADEMGIFEIGDRLQGVGELPLAEGGFERVVEMLQDQPRNAEMVTLHFDRKSALAASEQNSGSAVASIYEGPIQVSDQGAWSSLGRRKAQEDAFILHEVHDTKERSVLLAGVMDGHLGRAASNFVQDELPNTFSELLLNSEASTPCEEILESAWERTCLTYQNSCISGDECVADYDPREGLLMANTGSVDAIAGTTSTIIALDQQTSHLAFLNCGDSRGLVVRPDGTVEFETADHTPESEAERLMAGQQQGLDYSTPKCTISKWTVSVGEYEYAVARSLEGPLATAKGIVATPDVRVIQATPDTIALVATDGLWEVLGSQQVARIVTKLKQQQSMSAGDVAKTLCSMAIEKGSADNVSAVVVYLE